MATRSDARQQRRGPSANHFPNQENRINTTQALAHWHPPNQAGTHNRRPHTHPQPHLHASTHRGQNYAPHPATARRTAALFAACTTRLFGSTHHPLPSPRSSWQRTLPSYLSRLLSTSGLPTPVAAGAIALLPRYKAARPYSVAYGDDATRLCVAACLVAAKLAGAPAGRAGMAWWARVAGGAFCERDLVRMERELCRVVGWELLPDREVYGRVLGAVSTPGGGGAIDRGGGGRGGGGEGRGEWMEDELAYILDEEHWWGDDDHDDAILDDWEEWHETDEDIEGSERHYRMNPPPPPYSATAHDVRILEAPPYIVGGATSRQMEHDQEEINDLMRLAVILAEPATPPLRGLSIRRRRPRQQLASPESVPPVEERVERRRGINFLEALRERAVQLLQRRRQGQREN